MFKAVLHAQVRLESLPEPLSNYDVGADPQVCRAPQCGAHRQRRLPSANRENEMQPVSARICISPWSLLSPSAVRRWKQEESAIAEG